MIGDAANVPASKAGSVTHFEGEMLVENVARFLAGEPLDAGFDGHANCFIETGFHKALLIDFNYDTEPLPGHFPAAVGLPLLKESRLNHLGKLMFQWFYWHACCPAATSPGSARHAHRRQARSPRPRDLRRRRSCPPPPSPAPPSTVNDEGFFTDPDQWTEAMAAELAAAKASTS